MRKQQHSLGSSYESFPVVEIPSLDIYQVLEEHQSLSKIQPCNLLDSESFKKTQSCLANSSVQFSLLGSHSNSCEERLGEPCQVEFELVRHDSRTTARCNKLTDVLRFV